MSNRYLKPKPQVSSLDFYKNGGCYTQMESEIYESFELAFSLMEWEDYSGPEFNKIPKGLRGEVECNDENISEFKKAELTNLKLIDEMPLLVKMSIERLLKSRIFSDFHGVFDFEVKVIDLWDGSEGIPWHCDHVDHSDMIILSYFSDYATWPSDFGGELELGVRQDMSSIYKPSESDNITSVGIIPPSQTSVAVVNNTNPLFLHRCFRLTQKYSRRITLSLGVDLITKNKINEVNVVFKGVGPSN